MTLLFAFFGLWETTLAAAAGAASIPIIIHLLNRKRFRIVTWAAMKFLLMAQRRNTRRMRLEQLILLAMRVLIVLLVVLAMASVMPWAERVWGHFFPDMAGFVTTRSGRTYKIIVLDASLSMNLQGTGGKTNFDRARNLAAKMVREAPSGDGFSVVLLKESPIWIVAEPSQDGRKVAAEIEQLQATHGNASVAAVLNVVADKLAEVGGRFPSREVYFFTDMQQATWVGGPISAKDGPADKEKSPLQEIQKRARTIFVDLGRDDASNLAVTDLRLAPSLVTAGALVPISATVQNFGAEPRKARIALLTGKAQEAAADGPLTLRIEAEERHEVRPGDRVPVNFPHKFNAAGLHVVQVRLLADEGGADGPGADNLDPDNARSVVVPVRETVPVLLVNGKPAVERFDQGTEYVRLALNPFPANGSPPWAPLRPKVVNPSQFGDAGEGDLAGYDCVFLCDVPQLGTGELRRLESHLRQGGGVVMSLGDRVAEHLQAYNRLFYRNDQGLLPAKLEKKVQAGTDNYFVLQAEEDAFLEPPLKAFADSGDRDTLRSPRFRQYVQAKRAADARARGILSFMPEVDPLAKAELDKSLPINDPAIVEWNPPLPRDADQAGQDKAAHDGRLPGRYRGKVVLVTTSLNMDWHSWPGSPSFGAMMQELVRLAVSGKLQARAGVVGQTIEEPLPAASDAREARILPPNPKEIAQRQARDKAIREGKYMVREFLDKPRKAMVKDVAGLNVIQWGETDLSGVYLAIHGRAQEEIPIAVNVPATTADQRNSESDLTRVGKDKLREAYGGWEFQVVSDPKRVAPAPGQEDDLEVVRGRLGPVIANYLLLAVLALLIAEVILAFVFGHYSAVAGAPAQEAKSHWWPALIGGIALALFLGGAFVLIDATRSGDFLGFLPDSARSGIESWLNIPPPDAGEARRWNLEFMPYLFGAGNDPWLVAGIALLAGLLVFLIYRAEAPHVPRTYKWLLAGLRLFLILFALTVLLPQLQFRIDRQGWPDIALIVDTSRSMGEPDHYQDDKLQEAARRLGEAIREREKSALPRKIQSLLAELDKAKVGNGKGDAEALARKLRELENQRAQINSPGWRPTRLQLAQAILAQTDNDWLQNLLHKRRFKAHFFQLDANGRAIRLADAGGPAGDVTQPDDPQQVERARKALSGLEAEGKESRLGSAVRQVLDFYRGSSLTAVIMMTDGVTTRDETLAQVADYAAQKGVPLFFVGIGDDHPIRDLKLHDLKVEDTVYVNDRVVFEANLTGHGYKDLTVPVVLKVKDKDKEKVLAREMVRVDPTGKSKKIQLRDQPRQAGRKLYIVEIELPKADRPDKAISNNHTRLERTIDVLDSKLIRVLYVEGMPRYEFRFIKSLLERERPDEKNNRSIDLKVVLLDADAEFPAQDRTALADFPASKDELEQYDVVIVGDCNPQHPKLREKRLRNLADFVRGEDREGRRSSRTGGGLLMIAGPNYSPHAFRDTPLAEVLPIEPNPKAPSEPEERLDSFRLQITPTGRQHPSFRFSPDDADNQSIVQRLPPMYWWSEGYRIKPLAEVLAVHPLQKAQLAGPGQDPRHPLAVQHFVGSGRSMFFGFDETWRWRFRENEARFNDFWIRTMRYLSRTRITRTVLRLDRQTPYRVGEPISVTVQFPDNTPLPGKPGGSKIVPKDEVRVIVEYRPISQGDEKADPEIQTLHLKKVKGSMTSYEALLSQTREGKYHFWLASPDVSKEDPSGQKPSADAQVDRPPGELDRLRMNQDEMTQAGEATRGRFYSLADANQLLDELPAGVRVSLNASRPPFLLWNQVALFALVLFLLTAEWVLRKRKHLL